MQWNETESKLFQVNKRKPEQTVIQARTWSKYSQWTLPGLRGRCLEKLRSVFSTKCQRKCWNGLGQGSVRLLIGLESIAPHSQPIKGKKQDKLICSHGFSRALHRLLACCDWLISWSEYVIVIGKIHTSRYFMFISFYDNSITRFAISWWTQRGDLTFSLRTRSEKAKA